MPEYYILWCWVTGKDQVVYLSYYPEYIFISFRFANQDSEVIPKQESVESKQFPGGLGQNL